MINMLGKKEILVLLLITLVFAVTLSFLKMEIFAEVLLAVFIVLVLNIAAKKISAFYLESDIEIKLWRMERYGFKRHEYFKRPFEIGIFLPIIVSLVSLGNLLWMASMVFDVKPKVYRAAKRHGLYSFSEMTEAQIGMIAAAGVLINLVAAVIAYFLGFPLFARLNVYFAFFSMLPLSDLDGNKIFFGNIVLWSFLATLVLIGLGYAFFLT
jgi:Zn-dependent protease